MLYVRQRHLRGSAHQQLKIIITLDQTETFSAAEVRSFSLHVNDVALGRKGDRRKMTPELDAKYILWKHSVSFLTPTSLITFEVGRRMSHALYTYLTPTYENFLSLWY